MSKQRIVRSLAIAALILGLLSPPPASAEEPDEIAGMAIGVAAGNMWFVPIKAISVVMGATAGAVSFVFSGGNAELTQQIWRDTTEGPYLITPEVARKAIGERPELKKQ
ncbi:MAG: hypothetical protein HYY45_07410 [Deltaproteobacteria bacterium]|nr:hypothetical protein [Deltaproteobacteria bacterium]